MTDDAPTTLGFRRDIQGLRAVAVLAVILFHAHVPFFGGGYIGVDVFFVISGFLITTKLLESAAEHGWPQFLDFYTRRARRLLPAALVVILATVALGRFFGPISGARNLAWDAVASSLSVMNYRLIHRNLDYLQSSGAESWFLHFWSLAVEEQFYLVWPLLIAVAAYAAQRFGVPLRTAAGVALLIVFCGSLAASVLQTTTDPVVAYHSVHTRAWELAAGGLIAVYGAKVASWGMAIRWLAAWAGLLAIVAAATFYDQGTAFPGYTALLPVAGAVLIIAAQASEPADAPRSVLTHPVAEYIGKHSYALYLWHWPVMMVATELTPATNQWVWLLTAAGVAMLLAVATHHLVERPAMTSSMALDGWVPLGVCLVAGTTVISAGSVTVLPQVAQQGPAVEAAPLTVAPTATEKATPDPMNVLSQGIGVALETSSLPSNLRPKITSVADAVPEPVRDGCHLDFLETSQQDCAYGGNGPKTIVLFGDSHAGQWFPALEKIAKQHGFVLHNWTKAGCGVADVQIRSDILGRDYDECSQWRAATVDRITTLKPDLVIAGQSDNMPGDQVSDHQWADQTVAVLNAFTTAHIPVTFMLDTPTLPEVSADCLADHENNVQECTHKVATITERPIRRQLITAKLASAQINTLDPTNWLCHQGKCPPVVGQYLVFRDEDHITSHYAEYLSGVLDPVITARLS